MKPLPRLEISRSKIFENTKVLVGICEERNISVMGVTKVVLGNSSIAKTLCEGGVDYIADSRMENLVRMRESGVISKFVLLRTLKSEAEIIVKNIDISLNTEIEILEELSVQAQKQTRIHQVVIMIELGDLREGVMPEDILSFIDRAKALKGIRVVGIGCNLACLAGVKPDQRNMDQLSEIAKLIEKKCNVPIRVVSGGNSANYNWLHDNSNFGKINNLRLGESIFLGLDPLNRREIFGLHTDAFRLFGEVIESKCKPSLPTGTLAQNSFGEISALLDRGVARRVIVALGRQDVDVKSLKPLGEIEILGSSSDHIVIDSKTRALKIGDEVGFGLGYPALLAAMTSPFVQKVFV